MKRRDPTAGLLAALGPREQQLILHGRLDSPEAFESRGGGRKVWEVGGRARGARSSDPGVQMLVLDDEDGGGWRGGGGGGSSWGQERGGGISIDRLASRGGRSRGGTLHSGDGGDGSDEGGRSGRRGRTREHHNVNTNTNTALQQPQQQQQQTSPPGGTKLAPLPGTPAVVAGGGALLPSSASAATPPFASPPPLPLHEPSSPPRDRDRDRD